MSGKIRFDSRLLRRYAKLKPFQYCHPVVPLPGGDFGERQYRDCAKRSNAALIPKPIFLYAHVPAGAGTDDHAVEQLLRETELVAPLFDYDRDVVRLQCSGAPDRLNRRSLARLVESLARHFHLTDPARWDFLIDLDRTNAAAARITASRAAGARNVEVALTFGLAREAPDAFVSALQALVDAHPDGIHLYDGALKPGGQGSVAAVDAATRLSMLERAVNLLISRGYHYTGNGQFQLRAGGARPFDVDLVGIGPGARSHFGDGISENIADTRRWQGALDARRLPVARGVCLELDDRLRADVLKNLLCAGKVDIAAVERRFGIAFDARFADLLDALRPLEAENLVRISDGHIAVTSQGRYLWHIIADCFESKQRCLRPAVNTAECHVEESQRGDIAQ